MQQPEIMICDARRASQLGKGGCQSFLSASLCTPAADLQPQGVIGGREALPHACSVLGNATDAVQAAHPCPHLVCCGSISRGSPEPGGLLPQLQDAHAREVQL